MPRPLARLQDLQLLSGLSPQVPDAALAGRICGRWVHAASGRSYHAAHAPPQSLATAGAGAVPSAETMRDDETGEALGQRADDTAAALATRLQLYHEQTEPILDRYGPAGVVRRVDGDRSPGEVWAQIERALSS